nr:MAG TPA: tail tube protein [Bacteriophage sp.]
MDNATALDNAKTITVNGREYTLKFTMNALRRAEPQLTKKSILAALAEFSGGTTPLTDVVVLFKEAVRAGTPAVKAKTTDYFDGLWEAAVEEYGLEKVVTDTVLAVMASGIIGSKKEMAAALTMAQK